MTTSRQRRIVAACCARALSAGVRAGMPLSDAGALLPRGGARVLDAQPRRERAALRCLAERMQRFTPIVAVDPPDGLTLNIAGCAHLFGGEASMRRRVVAALARLGVAARAAVGSTVGCAWAVSRFGGDDPGTPGAARDDGTMIVAPGEERRALEPLPIDALRLDEDSRRGLSELSIERVGQIFDLPRAALPGRFGINVLRRLDEATGTLLGSDAEFIDPVRVPEPIRAERVFEGPTTRVDAIELASRRVIGELIPALAERGCGVTRLELDYPRSDLPPERIAVVLTTPSRDAGHLWKLVAPRLERLHMGFGVTGVLAGAVRVGRVRQTQATIGNPTRTANADRAESNAASDRDPEHEQRFAELLDALVNRLGPERVLRAELVESHLPERAVKFRSVLDPPTAGHREPEAVGSSRPALGWSARPSVLFERPEPADVLALTPDGPVHRLTWRGRAHEVITCIGPERIAPEWWRGRAGLAPRGRERNADAPRSAPARDYFKVQDDTGRWLWVCRAHESGCWFVHGEWA